jgi:hypothetical protein
LPRLIHFACRNRPTGYEAEEQMRTNHRDGQHAPDLPGRRAETKLQLPVGEPDLEALRSVSREWLVPLLVEKFLREQGIELRARPNAGPGKTPRSDR